MKLLPCLALAGLTFAQNSYLPADFASLANSDHLAALVERYSEDRGNLSRFHNQVWSKNRITQLGQFLKAWQNGLGTLPFDKLSQNGKVDYLLLKNKLAWELDKLAQIDAQREEILSLVPFLEPVVSLQEARQRVEPLDAAKAAGTLVEIDKQIAALEEKAPKLNPAKTVANRAAAVTSELESELTEWFNFYNEYDPSFTWWAGEPFKRLRKRLPAYSKLLREKLAGVKPDDKDTIIGDPIGRDALLKELSYELVAYTPEQLVEIANREFAWCEREMKRASQELGFGDDWKRALEHVKNLYVPPGQQTALVRDLALEAIGYMEKNDLVTVPALAKDTWRMRMMSPERQRINPFFTGGEVISVSYPTSGMSHEEKMMSMRGNNIHFSRATVFHELIPGHHLQSFMTRRYMPYREAFRTPFWGEGWALYWEMVLWDRGFAKSPENRVGMLFWRMHRCARIIFSLSFHLGKMTAADCVGYLVERVGHERENAAGEVRRSFESTYAPLYQAAYMLGALQFRTLRKELVDSSRMSERAFHDAVLHLNSIPVEMVRATLTGLTLQPAFTPNWEFYPGIE